VTLGIRPNRSSQQAQATGLEVSVVHADEQECQHSTWVIPSARTIDTITAL